MTIFNKLKGGGALPPRESIRNSLIAGLGGFCAIGLIAGLSSALETPLILGSFGASCVLVFGFPKVPFSQPRNVILGHFISSLIGLVFFSMFGAQWWSTALAIAFTIPAMLLTRTVHPPAGSNPVIVMLTQPSWAFLFTPTLIGALLLVFVAIIFNNIGQTRRYPEYWIGR
jgi:CBS-domain-containing membrane protein